jgi:hypothetical protein
MAAFMLAICVVDGVGVVSVLNFSRGTKIVVVKEIWSRPRRVKWSSPGTRTERVEKNDNGKKERLEGRTTMVGGRDETFINNIVLTLPT